MRVLSAAVLATAFAARYANPGGERSSNPVVDLQAAAQKGTVENIEAGAFKTAALPQGKQQWVRATGGHFLVAGELIQEGEYVQVQKDLARRLIHSGQAEAATDEQVQQARAAAEDEESTKASKAKK